MKKINQLVIKMNNNEKKQLLQLMIDSHNIKDINEVTNKIKTFIDYYHITILDIKKLREEKLISSCLEDVNENVFDTFTYIWFSQPTTLGKFFINN